MQSSFKSRAAGQAKLKQFFKYTHPDFFGGAPQAIRDTNLKSVQELNEYLTSVGNPLNNNGVEKKELTFYIKATQSPLEKGKRRDLSLEPG